MNWTILNRLAGADKELQDYVVSLHNAINQGLPPIAMMWTIRAAHITHELMDRADDLDELERRDRLEGAR